MESSIQTTNKSAENNHLIFIKSKTGVYFLQPMVNKDNKLLALDNASIIVNSLNLSAVKSYIHYNTQVLIGGIVFIYDTTTLELLRKFEENDLVTALHFSPNNKFLIIIQKPSVTNNLKIISLQDYTTVCNIVLKIMQKYCFHSTTHPSSQWPQIRFSSNEDYMFRIQKGVLDIYKLDTDSLFDPEVKYGTLTGIINFEIAEISNDQIKETAVICGKVIVQYFFKNQIDEKTKKKKSLFSFYRLSDLSKPVKEMNISMCDRMSLKISSDRKFVLAQSISDDTSNSSYYGESTLYYADLLYGKFQKISLAEGPINDFDWAPNGRFFITCAGHQPSKVTMFDCQAKFVKEICVSTVNTVRISPDSRILCLAGFGNLSGGLEFYRLSDYTLVGKTKFHCGITLNWSQDSKFLLGAVLSPRIRVDNEFKIFTYNGEDVIGDKFNTEVYECDWIKFKGKSFYSLFQILLMKNLIQM